MRSSGSSSSGGGEAPSTRTGITTTLRRSDVIAGIEWCANQAGVQVISMSLGSGGPSDGLDSLSQAANAAADAGKVVVVAAGNTGAEPGTVESPGAAEKAITVGACAEWSVPTITGAQSRGIYIAPFSSRGPITDGSGNPRPYVKPDVCAPGHTVSASEGGTGSGYVTFSGTSMATPFVSGAMALALQANPALTPAQAKQFLDTTAQDRGSTGKDADWGAGLLDVKALVAKASGATAATSFPAYLRIEGSVPDNVSKEFSFTVADPNVPIAAMVTINGIPKCVFPFFGSCLGFEWSPDLDAELLDPNGNVLATSGCAGQPPAPALQGETADLGCGIETNGLYLFARGRQETLRAIPTGTGDYRIRITPAADSSNNGKGGSFALDISNALASGGGGSPPPTAVHVGDLDGSGTSSSNNRWKATVTIGVHDASHLPVAGLTVSGAWSGGYTGNSSCTTGSNGRCSVTSGNIPKRKTSATFAVTNISSATGSFTYQSGANHDPDGDSNGTAITVQRP